MEKQPQTNPSPRARRAALIALFAFAIAATVLFSIPDLFPFADERMGRLLSDTVPRFAVGIFLAALLLWTDEYRAALSLSWKRLPRSLIWSVPCLMVAFANFPYSALISGSAHIDRPDLVWLFLLKCLSVALLEEMFFRAMLVPFVRARIKGRLAEGWTVLITAAVFALSHLLNLLFGAGIGPTLLQVGYTFLLGCMFAVMFFETGGVWLCVLTHFIFDIGGVIVTDLGSGPFQDKIFWILTVLTAVICAAHIVYTVVRRLKQADCSSEG